MAMIPSDFTQRGVLGGDSLSGWVPEASRSEGGSAPRTSSAGRAVLARDDACRGLKGLVMLYRRYRDPDGSGSVRCHRLA